GLAVVSPADPEVVVAARLGSPLVVGVGEEEHFLASDPAALVGQTNRMVFLEDRQLCRLGGDEWHIRNEERVAVTPAIRQVDWPSGEADKGGFEQHVLKEIHEQPQALENVLRGRLLEAEATAHFGGLNLDSQRLRQVERVILTACGTSYHAALVGEYLLEEFARIPVEVEYASEFRYRNPPIDRNTIVVALTQPGATPDTLPA